MTALDSLSCFACGTVDHSVNEDDDKQQTGNMFRASVSRRAEHHINSPPPRARSQERASQNESHRDIVLDKAIQDRSSSPTTTSTTTSCSDSSSIKSLKHRLHQRAMSDPFDAQEQDDDDNDDSNGIDDNDSKRFWMTQQQQVDVAASNKSVTSSGATTTDVAPLPTFPRFPVSATRNRNCWSEPPISLFKVRSEHYLTNGRQKTTSGPFMLTARGCDLLLLNTHGAPEETGGGRLSMIHDKLHLVLEGRLRSEPTLAINFQFPWGVMVLYWHVPTKLAPYMCATPIKLDAKLSTAERTLAKWLMGNDDYKNERLKLIPLVAEGPWVVRKLVTGTPAIIGKKLPVQHVLHPSVAANGHLHEQQPLIMSTLDIGSGSATAKRIVSVCRRYMSALTVDIGLVIQGDTPEELPEQMLGSIRIHGPDPLKAWHISR
ncbi:hypothetical protein MPSEU_000182200 [Mayamaea pseudoterrestris]|nr:hypothetical protein MPSEU_000182200 [Mayamaea pseudoterrestris]